ncbi:energy transducer TonB [Sphingomonas sp. MMS24-J45]|uniref:energy transducer TonB n=1 Tax=Sphingomonas sp. MMS24-J45 TaxID=3238806 RepID=UPI00384CD120
MRVLFAVLASAAALQSDTKIEITPSNVELTEAGKFDFDFASLAAIRMPPDPSVNSLSKVKVWFGPAGGSPLACEPLVSSTAVVSKAVCDRITASARFTFYPGFAQPLERGFVTLYLFRSSRVRSKPSLDGAITPGYTGMDLQYPPDTTPEAARLGPSDGTFEIAVKTDDYPVTALGAELQGSSHVLLGIASDGRVETCRPIRSSGAAVLDNATCAVFARRGRFHFSKTPPTAELRYLRHSMNWHIPTD